MTKEQAIKAVEKDFGDYKSIQALIQQARVERSVYLGHLIGGAVANAIKFFSEKTPRVQGEQQIRNRMGIFRIN